MKIDRVFVLLLVVMLPMTGCFDDAVGDADAQEDASNNTSSATNIPPVFHIASLGFEDSNDYGRVSTYNSSTGEELSRMYHVTPQFWFSVTDPDSNIIAVGIDLDLDHIIDHNFTNNDSWSYLSFYKGPDIAQSTGSLANYGTGEWASNPNYCYVRFNLMALDDEGGVEIFPLTLNIEGNDKLPSQADGCQSDYTNVPE